MVKVQKPNPKTLKKDDSAKPKNITMKKSKVNSKEKVKSIEKTIKKVDKKELVKEAKPKAAGEANKAKKVQQTVQKPVTKPIVKNEEKKIPPKENKVLPQNQKQQIQKKKPVPGKVEAKNQTVKKEVSVKKEQKPTVKKAVAKILPVNKEQQKHVAKKADTIQKVQNKKKNKQNIKEKKDDELEQKSMKPLFVPTAFDEDKFKEIVSMENLKKVTNALKTQVEKEVSEKKTSIFSDYRYFLNIASYKIPNCPKRMVKLNVKHSLVDPNNDDVVLIVPDLQRGAKVDYEPTIQHYEDLLREHGVENIKIMPFNQLRNEFTTFEAKRKFANTYDYFMCDGRIVSHAVGFCGKHFQRPRTTLHAVRLDNPKTYKSDIEHALRRTAFKQLHKGDLISIPVGNDRFTTKQVAENVHYVIEQLKKIFPGGYPNIRNIYLKIDIKGTSALPIYVNLSGAPSENVNVIGPREQRMLKLKKEANEVLSKFSMSKTGEFVKLSKTQVERKQQIRDARAALLEKDDKDNKLKPPAKKAKKDKPIEKVVEEEEEENDEDDDVEGDDDVEDDVEEDEDDVEEDEDDVEEDDDEEDDDDEDEEEDSDD